MAVLEPQVYPNTEYTHLESTRRLWTFRPAVSGQTPLTQSQSLKLFLLDAVAFTITSRISITASPLKRLGNSLDRASKPLQVLQLLYYPWCIKHGEVKLRLQAPTFQPLETHWGQKSYIHAAGTSPFALGRYHSPWPYILAEVFSYGLQGYIHHFTLHYSPALICTRRVISGWEIIFTSLSLTIPKPFASSISIFLTAIFRAAPQPTLPTEQLQLFAPETTPVYLKTLLILWNTNQNGNSAFPKINRATL